jgi:uncharacterized membrane protein
MSEPFRHHRPMLGILLKLIWVVVFSATSAGVKYLGPEVPPGQTIFVRSAIAVVVLVLLAWSTGQLHLLKTSNWRSHALRSLSGAAGMFLIFAALARAPIADVMAVSYTSPIFVTLLAMLLLGERIRVHRWTAVGIGCAGTLIIVRPYLSFDASHFTGIALAMGLRDDGLRHGVLARHEHDRASDHDHVLFLADDAGRRGCFLARKLADVERRTMDRHAGRGSARYGGATASDCGIPLC